jgi:hypothetical protein
LKIGALGGRRDFLSSISAIGLNYAWILQDLFQISASSRVSEGIDNQPAVDVIYYIGLQLHVRKNALDQYRER